MIEPVAYPGGAAESPQEKRRTAAGFPDADDFAFFGCYVGDKFGYKIEDRRAGGRKER